MRFSTNLIYLASVVLMFVFSLVFAGFTGLYGNSPVNSDIGPHLLAPGLLGIYVLIKNFVPTPFLLANTVKERDPYNVSLAFTVGLGLFLAHILTVFLTVRDIPNLGVFFRVIPCLILIVYGVVMIKSEPNSFAGIRLPWVLSSQEVWHKTHVIVGPLTSLFGALWLVSALFFDRQTFLGVGLYIGGPLILLFVVISLIIYFIENNRNVVKH